MMRVTVIHLLKRKSRNASKDLFDKDINLLVPDAEKHDESDKRNSAANDLGISEDIKSKDELGPAYPVNWLWWQMRYRSEEPKYAAVVNKILQGLKIPADSSDVCAYIKWSCA